MKDLKTPAALGLCTVMPLLAATSVDAGIITNTSLGLGSITVGPNMSSLYWNIDNTGSNEFQLVAAFSHSYPAIHLNAIDASAKIHVHTVGFSATTIIKVASNAFVGAAGGPAYMSQPFLHANEAILKYGQISQGNLNSGFTSGTPGYIGFMFMHNSKACYGWASITVTEAAGSMGSLTINSWAFEDSGLNLRAGADSSVPEPAETAAGLGALALGVAGLTRWRKNKAAKAA